ncbi:MAG: serine/threonine-protein kinase [Gemmataceae bacterium]
MPIAIRDDFVLRLLAAGATLSSRDLEYLSSWWKRDRHLDEDLTTFLIRMDIFGADAVKTLDLIQKGYLQPPVSAFLFQDGGLNRLRKQVAARTSTPPAPPPSPQPPAPPPSVKETSTPSRVAAPSTESRPAAVATVWLGTREFPASSASAPRPRAASVLPEVGAVLGKCLLTERLGQGSAGVVFRAMHQTLNIPVAVKVLHMDAEQTGSDAYAQLRSEARLLAQMNHPHVVRVLDFEDAIDFPYLVLEYVEGLSLAQLITQSGRLRWDRATEIIRQTALALAAASRLRIVHRDVKPGNILLTRDGTAKLADLGLAVVGGKRGGDGGNAPAMAGTAAYISPEQVSNSTPIDFRADIYSLGATFYHAVTGELPFTGRSRLEVMLKHVKEELVPPHQQASEVPMPISQLITRMMAKEPAARPADYDQLLADLERLPQQVEAEPNPSVQKSSGFWKLLSRPKRQ